MDWNVGLELKNGTIWASLICKKKIKNTDWLCTVNTVNT